MILSFKSAHALEMKKINRIKSTTAIVKLAAVAAATAAATINKKASAKGTVCNAVCLFDCKCEYACPFNAQTKKT